MSEFFTAYRAAIFAAASCEPEERAARYRALSTIGEQHGEIQWALRLRGIVRTLEAIS